MKDEKPIIVVIPAYVVIWVIVLSIVVPTPSFGFTQSENLVSLTTEGKTVIMFNEAVGTDFFTYFQQNENQTGITGIVAYFWHTGGRTDNDFFTSGTFPADHFDSEIADFQSIQTKLPDNLKRVNVGNSADWYNDVLWNDIFEKAKLYSDIVDRGGMRGFCVDTEQYGPINQAFNYAQQVDNGTYTFAQYQSKVQQRGRQLMQLLGFYKSDITILYTFGHSTAAASGDVNSLEQSIYGLLPSFIDGMMQNADALGYDVEFIDGFEGAYSFKKHDQFIEAANTIREEGKKLSSLPVLYEETMKVGFGLWPEGNLSPWYATASEFEYALHYGLLEGEMVWLFNGELLEWWINYPPEYIQVIPEARYPKTCLRDNFEGDVGEYVSAQVSFDIHSAQTNLPDKSFVVSGVDHEWTEGTLDGQSPPDGATDLTYDGTSPWTYLAPISGDYGSGDIDTIAAAPDGTPVGQINFDVTGLVTEWIDGRDNHGLVLRKSPGADGHARVFTRDSNYPPQLTVEYREQPSQQVILQGTAVTEDSYVCDWTNSSSARDINFNSGDTVNIAILGSQGPAWNKHSRSFIKFDISSVQAIHGPDTRVDSAKLKLRLLYEPAHPSRNPYSSETYGAYRMLANWNDDQVTFNERLTGVAWIGQQSSLVGGPWNTGDEIAVMPSDEVVVTWGNNRWETQHHEWDVTDDVNAWLSGAATNYGWFLRAKPWDYASSGQDPYDGWNGVDILTSEHGGLNRPQLVLEVTEVSVPTSQFVSTSPAKDTQLSGGAGTGLNYGGSTTAKAETSAGGETDRVIAEWALPIVVKKVPDTKMWKSTSGIRLDGAGNALFTLSNAQALTAFTSLGARPTAENPLVRLTCKLTEGSATPEVTFGMTSITDTSRIQVRTDLDNNWVVWIGDDTNNGYSTVPVGESEHSGKWRFDWRLNSVQVYYKSVSDYNEVLVFDSNTVLPDGGTDTSQWHIPANNSLRPDLEMVGTGTDAVDWIQWEWKYTPGDFNGDGNVDAVDGAILFGFWLAADCQADNDWCAGSDSNCLSQVDLVDFATFTQFWLQ